MPRTASRTAAKATPRTITSDDAAASPVAAPEPVAALPESKPVGKLDAPQRTEALDVSKQRPALEEPKPAAALPTPVVADIPVPVPVPTPLVSPTPLTAAPSSTSNEVVTPPTSAARNTNNFAPSNFSSSNSNNSGNSYGSSRSQGGAGRQGRQGQFQRRQQQYSNYQQRNSAPPQMEFTEEQLAAMPSAGTVTGILDNSRDGHGVLRMEMSGEHDRDTYISTSLIRRYRLRPGDVVTGPVRVPKENERYWGLLRVEAVNGLPPEEIAKDMRPKFKSLTPVYPNEKITLEVGPEPLSLRIVDLIAPIGKGQRSMIVSPPKAGKTTFLKEIASGVAQNHPEIHVMAVLVGERPEEVTDIRRHIAKITNGVGEVASSNFDESAEDQCRVAELALEKAKRMVEIGRDVIILLDSITRLARAYNLAIPTSGRTLSGGFDPAALFPPKKFFGAARNFEVQGSLTIVGTALVETGSRMDDLIYEEFKGTGNQEVHLDRRLAERRIYPAIDVQRSSTRRDDLLMDGMTYQSIVTLQRMLDTLDSNERTAVLVEQLRKTKSNKEFLATLKVG